MVNPGVLSLSETAERLLQQAHSVLVDHELRFVSSVQDPRVRHMDRYIELLCAALATGPHQGENAPLNGLHPLDQLIEMLEDGGPEQVMFDGPAGVAVFLQRVRDTAALRRRALDSKTPDIERSHLLMLLKQRRVAL